jgi:hypothetical protein
MNEEDKELTEEELIQLELSKLELFDKEDEQQIEEIGKQIGEIEEEEIFDNALKEIRIEMGVRPENEKRWAGLYWAEAYKEDKEEETKDIEALKDDEQEDQHE